MSDKLNREFYASGAATFNYNNVTGGADSGSGGSGGSGSGMDCLQLRAQPGPFHYLISEQAKSFVALQELQNEVGALLEFRDLVIETFPNLRSKMSPSAPAGARREWEPGVRVRRKLAGAGDGRKPQPSVQDSGFSTETSCGKDAHSSSASASASATATRSRPLEDELWALLDTIQRKGVRIRDEAELLRGELDERRSETTEESFARALSAGCGECVDLVRLREERDALLARAAQLEAAAAAASAAPAPAASPAPRACLGRLDATLERSPRTTLVPRPDSKKFTAILQESNPVELQRQLLSFTVKNQVYCEQVKRAAEQKTLLLERLERANELNEDLKFRLEEKSIELEGARARVRLLEGRRSSGEVHSSMRDMQPLAMPEPESAPGGEQEQEEEERLSQTPRRRPSRIPRHTAHKAAEPRPPSAHSAHSAHSARSVRSARSACARPPHKREESSGLPVRRTPPHEKMSECARESLAAEYVARTERLAPLLPALRPPHAQHAQHAQHAPRTRPLPHDLAPHNLALELTRSILYEDADSIDIQTLRSLNSHEDSLWHGKPQQYFESMNYGHDFDDQVEPVPESKDFESDSLAQ